MIWTVEDNCYKEIGGEDIEGCLDYFESYDVIIDLWIAWSCQWILVLPLAIGLLGSGICCPMKLSDVPKNGGEKRREDQDPDEPESTWRYDWMKEPNFYLALLKVSYNNCIRKKSRKEKEKEREKKEKRK